MQRWDELAEKFSHVTDKLDMPIDYGIFETVVALNALDIPTSASCAGHLDHGLPYPWVDIGRHTEFCVIERWQTDPAYLLRRIQHGGGHLSNLNDPPEIAHMRERIRELREHIRELEVQIAKSTTPEMKQMQQEVKRLQLEERYTLFKILSEFYQGRAVSYDRIITIEHGRIRSQGGDYLLLLSEDERAKKMNEYSEEMRNFTAFLKSIYFDSSKMHIGD